MTPQEVEAILERYINDTCTLEERRFVEKSFEAMSQDHDDLEPSIRLAMHKRLLTKLQKEIEGDNEPDFRNRYLKIGRAAAVLLLLVVSFFLINKTLNSENTKISKVNDSSKMARFFNTTGALKKIKLKDGSTVELHAGGELSISGDFGNKREVRLTGEAFFEVAKDAKRPFIVYANEVTTKVLGTSFRIKAYKQEKEVTVAVKTGKVSVYTKSSGEYSNGSTLPPERTIILTPNQQVIYNRKKEQASLKLVDDPQRIQPQSTTFNNYTNTKVTQILQSLEESYGIQIQYDENILSGCTITSASEMLNEGLYDQIEIICNAIGAKYKFSGLSIIIDAQPCK